MYKKKTVWANTKPPLNLRKYEMAALMQKMFDIQQPQNMIS